MQDPAQRVHLAGGDDVQDLACNDICNLDADALEISPTTTDFDDNPAYIGMLDGLEAEKQELNPEQEIIVGLIGGVSLTDNRPYYSDVGAAVSCPGIGGS